MKLIHAIAPALAAILATACASNSQQASAPDRAAQAEADRQHAQDDARQAAINTEKARVEAQDAARAQYEADEKARFAAQEAAQAERDAQVERGGVAEPQRVEDPATVGRDMNVAFAVSSDDLTDNDKARLGAVADSLRAHPSRTVVVEGYSDDVHAEGHLARRRADCVTRFLEKRGIPGDRISTRVGTRNAVRYSDTDDYTRRGLYRGVDVLIVE